jgi:hypothetical protein
MYDCELAREVLHQIINAIDIIIKRIESVNTANDFTDSPAGMEKLE